MGLAGRTDRSNHRYAIIDAQYYSVDREIDDIMDKHMFAFRPAPWALGFLESRPQAPFVWLGSV